MWHAWPRNSEREDLSSNSKNPCRSFMKRLSSLRELWCGCPSRLHTTKGTDGLNLLTFSDKIEQDAENGRWVGRW